MKKVTTLLIAVLFTSAAFGQSAISTQSGDYNIALIEQSGSGHNADITTIGDAASANQGNTATIRQTSTGMGDEAIIEQGRESSGSVRSTDALIEQQGNDGSVGANVAKISQNLYNLGRRAGSTVLQNGSGNNAYTVLEANKAGDKDRTMIDQDGFSNDAYQLKADERGGDLTIEQNNMASGPGAAGNFARQFANAGEGNVLMIRQVGDANQAVQNLAESSTAQTFQYGSGNEAYVYTTNGADDNIYVVQGWEVDDNPSSDNFAEIRADGGGNLVILEQDGAGENSADMNVSGGATVFTVQSGKGNVITGVGGTDPANILNGSSLTVGQGGNYNNAFVDMHAGGYGEISQSGNYNSTTIVQP